MTRDEFMVAVVNQRICSGAFSLGDEGKDECYVLSGNGSNWSVYYSERGLKTQRMSFVSESDALGHLLTTLNNDPSTKSAA
jgi:hypothetical protein